MIYNTLTLADATLTLFKYLYNQDESHYVLEAWGSLGESGYKLTNQDTSVAFAQSAAGDGLVIYSGDRWELPKWTQVKLDIIAVEFNCDDLFNAVKHIMETLGDE
jgi:hypothetical protein